MLERRRIILASASPRRRELLALGGWDFDVRPVEMPEIPDSGESPADFVRRMSQAKAWRAAEGAEPGAIVIGADTVVVLDGQILGKPKDTHHARITLRSLRGRTHEVLTGLTILDTGTGIVETQLARSRVPMRNYGDAEMQAYIATGDPLDKAGAYAIQHAGFRPVDRDQFEDCLANVMGLPLCHVLRGLRRVGVIPATDLPAACQRFIAYQCPVFEAILKEEF